MPQRGEHPEVRGTRIITIMAVNMALNVALVQVGGPADQPQLQRAPGDHKGEQEQRGDSSQLQQPGSTEYFKVQLRVSLTCYQVTK